MLTALSIILTVLKVIGIILLVLLALIILIVCLVLFGSIRVRVQVSHTTDDLRSSGSVSWLRVVLKAAFSYDESLSCTVKLLGIQIYPKKKKAVKKKTPDKKSDGKPKPSAETQVLPMQDQGETQTVPAQSAPGEKTEPVQTAPQTETADAGSSPEDQSPKRHRGKPARHKPEKKKRENPLHGVKAAAGHMQEILDDEAFRPALQTVFSAVGGFFGSIHVYELKGEATCSLGAPDLTGMATGVISLVPAAYGEELTLTPDFTDEEISFYGVLEGGLRFRLFHVLIAVIKIVRDKNVRKMMHFIRK